MACCASPSQHITACWPARHRRQLERLAAGLAQRNRQLTAAASQRRTAQHRPALQLDAKDIACCTAAAALARLGHSSNDEWPLQLRYRLLCGAALAVDGLPQYLNAVLATLHSQQQHAAWAGTAAIASGACAQTFVVLVQLIDEGGLSAGEGGSPAGSLASLLSATAATPPKLLCCLRFLGHCGDQLHLAGVCGLASGWPRRRALPAACLAALAAFSVLPRPCSSRATARSLPCQQPRPVFLQA